jgi:hypothetical protein
MKRSSFIKSLGVLASAAFIPESKSEKLTLLSYTSNADMSIGVNGVERMRIYSDGSVGMGMLNPKQILKVTNKNNI